MIELYLKNIGLNEPTRVAYHNKDFNRVEEITTYRLDIRSLVEIWKVCFNLKPKFQEKIYLYYPQNLRFTFEHKTLFAGKSIKEYFSECGVECVVTHTKIDLLLKTINSEAKMIRLENSKYPCTTCKHKPTQHNPACKNKEYDLMCDSCTHYYCCQNALENETACPYYMEENNDNSLSKR